MSQWIVLIEATGDLEQSATPHKVMTIREYIENQRLFANRRPNIVNLARSYRYQSSGYYASLLAEARGHRVIPSVQTMLELGRKDIYRAALPELETTLNADAQKQDKGAVLSRKMSVYFGEVEEVGFEGFGRILYDWFRAPYLSVEVHSTPTWIEIRNIRAEPCSKLSTSEKNSLIAGLARHTKRRWSFPKPKQLARWSLAVLHDPKETMPPTTAHSIEQFARVAEQLRIAVEPIKKTDLTRLAEHDALFIRETTSIDNHTYRFARRAEQEGMPVIDDTNSMIRCTNKIFLKERLQAANIPIPKKPGLR